METPVVVKLGYKCLKIPLAKLSSIHQHCVVGHSSYYETLIECMLDDMAVPTSSSSSGGGGGVNNNRSSKWETSLSHRSAKNLVSGTVAGIAGCLVGHPFDTVKVRLQTQPAGAAAVYRGPVHCAVTTLRQEGLAGLYKGVASPIVGQMFFRAVMFTSYFQATSIARTFRGSDDATSRLPAVDYYVCGAVTGAAVSAVEGPIDLLKTKLQIQIFHHRAGKTPSSQPQYRSVFHAGYCITRAYGIRGVYQGLGATLLRNVPSFSLSFGSYELLRGALVAPGQSVNDLPLWTQVLSGAFAGFMYWIFTYPTDVVKSAMQSDHSAVARRRYTGVVHCARSLYRDGGPRGFYRGFTPCLARSVPVGAVLWLVVEACRSCFP